jgi:hypothetical protein
MEKKESMISGMRLNKEAHVKLGMIAARLGITKTQALERAVDYAAESWLGPEILKSLSIPLGKIVREIKAGSKGVKK